MSIFFASPRFLWHCGGNVKNTRCYKSTMLQYTKLLEPSCVRGLLLHTNQPQLHKPVWFLSCGSCFICAWMVVFFSAAGTAHIAPKSVVCLYFFGLSCTRTILLPAARMKHVGNVRWDVPSNTPQRIQRLHTNLLGFSFPCARKFFPHFPLHFILS